MAFIVTVIPQQQFNPGDPLSIDALNLLAQSTFTISGSTTALTDVSSNAPTNNQVLVWNSGTSKWTPAAVPAMVGATLAVDGTGGAVPAPLKANIGQFLRGDGTWAVPDATAVTNEFLKSNSY